MAIRIIIGVHPRTHTEPLLQILKLFKCEDINKYLIGRLIFRIQHNELPIYQNFFTRNRDVSSIGRPFRSPLRRRRNMAALPLPAAILDDLIPSFLVPGMRSSKMAAGSGRAAILRLRLNGDRKGRPKSWLTSFPAPPS